MHFKRDDFTLTFDGGPLKIPFFTSRPVIHVPPTIQHNNVVLDGCPIVSRKRAEHGCGGPRQTTTTTWLVIHSAVHSFVIQRPPSCYPLRGPIINCNRHDTIAYYKSRTERLLGIMLPHYVAEVTRDEPIK